MTLDDTSKRGMRMNVELVDHEDTTPRSSLAICLDGYPQQLFPVIRLARKLPRAA